MGLDRFESQCYKLIKLKEEMSTIDNLISLNFKAECQAGLKVILLM